ncbi:peroxidase-like protein [Haliotis rubra]|uniref:peroxidase-like protein n=1 Tax=Haliotis rubra TaxID=36100 RepID=UPI001EE54CDB|nr:peroxidase-like protein [Haliotis rubra]
MTYEEILALYVDYVKKKYNMAVIVFDGYGEGMTTKTLPIKKTYKGQSSHDDVAKAGEEALVCLYGGNLGVTLDQLRYRKFCEKVSTSFSCVLPQSLPPTENAAQFHSYRVFYQVQEWADRSADMNPADWEVDSFGPSTRASHTTLFKSNARARALGEQYLSRISAARAKVRRPQPGATRQTFPEAVRQVLMTLPSGGCATFVGVCNITNIYRSSDGSCNNLANPTWGMSDTPRRRYLTPQYDDVPDWSAPLSTPDDKTPKLKFISNMLVQWGQFLVFDITSTPVRSGAEDRPLTCCSEDVPFMLKGILDPSLRDGCFPISIPRGDRFFSRRCMNFPRSIQIDNTKCTGVPAEQINQQTAYIDASQVYGPTAEETAQLRTMVDGLVQAATTDNQAGMQQISLQHVYSSLMFTRRSTHINPHWSDETLFQETRRIVIAISQKITYNHYLPLLLNKYALDKYRLTSPKSGYYDVYSSSTDAGIVNAFSTAAMRFGHSSLRSVFSRLRPDFSLKAQDRLFQMLTNTAPISSRTGLAVNEYLRGNLVDRSSQVDRFISRDLTDKLFILNGSSLDLAAVNIQRGRDHGLPGYTAYRELCGLSGVFSFRPAVGGLIDHDPHTARLLQSVYRHPNDIDLFTGGVSEKPIPGSLVGPVFTCLLGSQFSALKRGDRFWYELSEAVTRFTPAQLAEIRKVTLSRVLCDNTNTLHVQRDAFRVQSKAVPRLDLTMWTEQQPRWSNWSAESLCTSGSKFQFRRRSKCLDFEYIMSKTTPPQGGPASPQLLGIATSGSFSHETGNPV